MSVMVFQMIGNSIVRWTHTNLKSKLHIIIAENVFMPWCIMVRSQTTPSGVYYTSNVMENPVHYAMLDDDQTGNTCEYYHEFPY